VDERSRWHFATLLTGTMNIEFLEIDWGSASHTATDNVAQLKGNPMPYTYR